MQYIHENFTNAPSMDLSPSTLDMLVHLMCAQARECLFEKAELQVRRTKAPPGMVTRGSFYSSLSQLTVSISLATTSLNCCPCFSVDMEATYMERLRTL